MSNLKVGEENCQRMLGQMDAFLDRSLPEEPMHQLRTHLDGCPACTQELALRKNVRARMRSAVKNIEAPAYLETRIRAHVRDARRPFYWRAALASAAAAVLVCIGALVVYQLGYLRLTVKSQEAYIGTVSNRVATIMRVGLGDHIHCSVFRKYPKNAPSVEHFVADMGPEYSGLIPIVRKDVPEDYRMVLAHQCRYHQRRFVHLALKSDSRLLSVVIARKGEGEAFTTEELVPALTESGIPIYRSGVQRFQIAAFESRDYLVYVISDLPQEQNMEMMRAMAPGVKAYLSKLEG